MHTVEKIGGTSITATNTVFDNVLIAGRKGADLYNRIFVVSAYAGMTDLLLENKKTGVPGVYGRFVADDAADGWRAAMREVVVSQDFATAHGLRQGSRLTVVMNGKRRELAVTGIALSPDGGTLYVAGGTDEGDVLRFELESLLARHKRILPVLVDDAQLPAEDALPEGLRPLLRYQAPRINNANWQAVSAAVVGACEAVLSPVPG